MRTSPDSGSSTAVPAPARIALACGGTGGDVLPALTVAEALPDDVEAVLLGDPTGPGARARIVRGHRLLGVPAAPFARRGLWEKGRSIAITAIGIIAARRLLRREDIRLVVGFGGYASVPVGLAAWGLGIPVILFEPNVVPGAANVLLSRFAERVLVGTSHGAGAFHRPTVVTGVPLRSEILRHGAHGPHVPLRVLVSGGSAGSPVLDARVPQLLALIAAKGHVLDVRHIGGVARAEAAYAAAGIRARVVAYVDDMATEYARADVAIVTGGATTLAELAAVGLPAIVVPLAAAARDHQTPNARVFADTTGAPWCREQAWDAERLATYVASLAASPTAWADAAAGMRRYAQPGATEAVVGACLDVLTRRGVRGAQTT